MHALRYRAALDAAVATQQVEVVANLLEELAARQGLASALGEAPSCILQSPCSVRHYVPLAVPMPACVAAAAARSGVFLSV